MVFWKFPENLEPSSKTQSPPPEPPGLIEATRKLAETSDAACVNSQRTAHYGMIDCGYNYCQRD